MKKTLTLKALSFYLFLFTSIVYGQNTALDFEGTSGAGASTMSGQLVYTSPMIPLTNSFTVMGWVYVNATHSQIFTWSSSSVNDYIQIKSSYNHKLEIYAPGQTTIRSTTNIVGGWHHVAVSNDSGTITLYVDGVNEASGSQNLSSKTPTNSSFGTALLNGSYQGSGNFEIDEFSFWDIALNSTQVSQYKDTPPSGGESGLVAAYNFNPAGVSPGGNNTALTTLTDLTGNYPGTLFGFSLIGTSGNYITSTNTTLGISDVRPEETSWRVYPNPTVDELYVDGIQNEQTFNVFNVLGETVLSGTVKNKINVKSLSKGMYFLNLTNNSSIKFIKN